MFVWAGAHRVQRTRPISSTKDLRNAGGTSVRRSMCVVSVGAFVTESRSQFAYYGCGGGDAAGESPALNEHCP